MKRYKVTVPFIPSMGSISPFVVTATPMNSKESDALWTINSMRDHDGLQHLTKLPSGTKFERIDN